MSERHKFVLTGAALAVASALTFTHLLTGDQFVKIALAVIGLHVLTSGLSHTRSRRR